MRVDPSMDMWRYQFDMRVDLRMDIRGGQLDIRMDPKFDMRREIGWIFLFI